MENLEKLWFWEGKLEDLRNVNYKKLKYLNPGKISDLDKLKELDFKNLS